MTDIASILAPIKEALYSRRSVAWILAAEHVPALIAAIEALQAERDALRVDAMRYRLLRDPTHWTQDFLILNEDETRFTHTEDLDAKLDAALSAQTTKEA